MHKNPQFTIRRCTTLWRMSSCIELIRKEIYMIPFKKVDITLRSRKLPRLNKFYSHRKITILEIEHVLSQLNIFFNFTIINSR